MDLAICWETPVDPVYESPRATHIDGSEGGLAPAIFTLIQRTPGPASSLCSSTRNEKSCSENENKGMDDKRRCCCDCLCKRMNDVSISKQSRGEERVRKSAFRKCIACEPRCFEDDPRQVKSAVGLALGLEKADSDQKRKTVVPRPRTPFARRSFCIDTLAPPFSVVNGCRSADYPEHWRLMSVYQQSYRNPYRRRNYRC